MSSVLAAVFGALATVALTAVVGPLIIAISDVARHDFEVKQRDDDLEEWIIVRDRQLKQRWIEINEAANVAGTLQGGTVPAGRTASQTLLLYDYREEVRKARAFTLTIEVSEQWTHRLIRKLRRRPFAGLTTPDRARPLIDYWSEGTARNALSWDLESILEELPNRATSNAIH